MKTIISAAVAATLAASAAFASGPGEKRLGGDGVAYLANGAFTYDVFEAAVEHVDLEGCPAEFDPEGVFCRMTLATDMAHVFVFAFSGDQPLLAVKSYELGDGFLPF